MEAVPVMEALGVAREQALTYALLQAPRTGVTSQRLAAEGAIQYRTGPLTAAGFAEAAETSEAEAQAALEAASRWLGVPLANGGVPPPRDTGLE